MGGEQPGQHPYPQAGECAKYSVFRAEELQYQQLAVRTKDMCAFLEDSCLIWEVPESKGAGDEICRGIFAGEGNAERLCVGLRERHPGADVSAPCDFQHGGCKIDAKYMGFFEAFCQQECQISSASCQIYDVTVAVGWNKEECFLAPASVEPKRKQPIHSVVDAGDVCKMTLYHRM